MHLTLHLTDRCNLACRYCYARPGTADMTLATALAAIDECTRGAENPGVIFFGGEPLLREDLIFDVIAACDARFALLTASLEKLTARVKALEDDSGILP